MLLKDAEIGRAYGGTLRHGRVLGAPVSRKKAARAEQKCADSKASGETQRPVIIRLNCEGNQEQ